MGRASNFILICAQLNTAQTSHSSNKIYYYGKLTAEFQEFLRWSTWNSWSNWLVFAHKVVMHTVIGVDPGKVEGGVFPPPPPPSDGVLRSPYKHILIIIVYYLICVVSVTLN